jgi:DEAD_2
MVSKDLEAETVIVFDEAHNIDSICIEALSVTINDRGLEQATRSLGRLSSEVSRLKATDSERLQQEYQNLVNGLIDQGLLDAPASEVGLGSVCLSSCMVLSCCVSSFLAVLLYIACGISGWLFPVSSHFSFLLCLGHLVFLLLECFKSRRSARSSAREYSTCRTFYRIHEKSRRASQISTTIGRWSQWRCLE